MCICLQIVRKLGLDCIKCDEIRSYHFLSTRCLQCPPSDIRVSLISLTPTFRDIAVLSFYSTADLICRLKYRTSVILLLQFISLSQVKSKIISCKTPVYSLVTSRTTDHLRFCSNLYITQPSSAVLRVAMLVNGDPKITNVFIHTFLCCLVSVLVNTPSGVRRSGLDARAYWVITLGH